VVIVVTKLDDLSPRAGLLKLIKFIGLRERLDKI